MTDELSDKMKSAGIRELRGKEKEDSLEFIKSASYERELPFVYELVRDGVKSFAIGTHHFSPHDFRKSAKPYIENAKHLCLEVDLDGFQECQDRACLIPATEYLGQLDQKYVLGWSDLLKMPVDDLNELSLVGLGGEILYKFLEMGFPGSTVRKLDRDLAMIAQGKGIPIVGLENAEEHAAAFIAELRDDAARFPKITGRDDPRMDDIVGSLRALMNRYADGDADMLDFFMEISGKDRDLEPRNKEMFQRSLPYMSEPSVIGVGLAHLRGENSMLDMYHKEGFSVKRV